MDSGSNSEDKVPSGRLTSIKFDILTERDIDLFSCIPVNEIHDVTDPRLGVPNSSSHCSTCGSSDIKTCDGHYGCIELPADICHPYYVPEIVQILNQLCPGCKSLRSGKRTKVTGSETISKKNKHKTADCKYCVGKSKERYPLPKFKYGRNFQIKAGVNEERFQRNHLGKELPKDYWDFIPKDLKQNDSSPFEMTLSPYQIYFLLKDLGPKLFEKFALRMELLFISRLPVTPNCNRVKEMMLMNCDGSRLIFDDLTKAYRRLVDVKRQLDICGPQFCVQELEIPNVVLSRVWECLKVSKLYTKKSSSTKNDSCAAGLKWFKEILLGKRTDNAFRMVVVGDPKLKLHEIGIPCDISAKLRIPENVNARNVENLMSNYKSLCFLKRRSQGESRSVLVSVRSEMDLQVGDTIYRCLQDGDLVLVNRNPSIHQHSLLAFSIKTLPTNSVISINPLSCAPLRADFDGDCLHGFIPQSVMCRVELSELVSLNQQLVNGQDGCNLLSISHDSLIAAYLITKKDVFLNKFQMQQMEMLVHHQSANPAILKAPLSMTPLWTGKQLFSMLLPQSFNLISPSSDLYIKEGDLLLTSGGSSWLRNTRESLFSVLLRNYPSKALEFLFTAQDVLCEWISTRGFSVSLSDVYLSAKLTSRRRLIEEVGSGLNEVEHIYQTKELMADSGNEHILMDEDDNEDLSFEHKYHCNMKPAYFNQEVVSAYKQVSRDLKSVIYNYASMDNSMLAIIEAGSKGSLEKLVQQSLCLGLQYSSVPLSFRIPSKLSCALWNQQNSSALHKKETYYGVVESSFLDGLNPLECFVHALSTRGNLFSDNADLPGTLTRKLMFYMRDICVSYDGTVRSAYGSRLIQFFYSACGDKVVDNNTFDSGANGGKPVGALAACAISEAAYSALDQPISTAVASPLVNLKKVLECTGKGTAGDQTLSVYMSKNLKRWRYGFEYGALQVQSFLERVFLADVVIAVMIIFSKQDSETGLSPWVIHFHLCKERMKKRRLTVESIIDALSREYKSARRERRTFLPRLQIFNGDCSLVGEMKDPDQAFCITVATETAESDIMLCTIREELIPELLKTVIRGFLEFKKVDILWDEHSTASKNLMNSSGEMYLKVHMAEICDRRKYWSSFQNACIQIVDLIDWERSRPNNIYSIFCAFGVDAAWKHFLGMLKSTLSDIGRTIHDEHLLLVADCLSVTGEFHGLNAKGIKLQRDQMSITSPFMQACFSNPSKHFIEAAKEGAEDNLLGTLDALVWGKEPPTGTGGPFDILYSETEQNLAKPIGVFEALSSQFSIHKDCKELKKHSFHQSIAEMWHHKDDLKVKKAARANISLKCERKLMDVEDDIWSQEEDTSLGFRANSYSRSSTSPVAAVDVVGNLSKLQEILHKYSVNSYVKKNDKLILEMALFFHPQKTAKMGVGVQAIKVGLHPEHQNSRCFIIVRKDGTTIDFSYRKCVVAAAKQIAPQLEVEIRNKLYSRGSAE